MTSFKKLSMLRILVLLHVFIESNRLFRFTVITFSSVSVDWNDLQVTIGLKSILFFLANPGLVLLCRHCDL